MQSSGDRTDHIQSISNDNGFAPLEKSSSLVLATRDDARFDGVLPAAERTTPADNTLSNRKTCDAGKDAVPFEYGPATGTVLFHRATLFERVMDVLDRYPSNGQWMNIGN